MRGTSIDQTQPPPPGVNVLSRIAWEIAGADPDLLVGCPPHERVKFSLLALIHAAIGLALAGLVYRVGTEVGVSLIAQVTSKNVHPAASLFAAFVSVFAFLGILRVLAFGLRMFTE